MKAFLIAPETRTQLLELLARIGDDDLAHPVDREAAVMIRPHVLSAPEHIVVDSGQRKRLEGAKPAVWHAPDGHNAGQGSFE